MRDDFMFLNASETSGTHQCVKYLSAFIAEQIPFLDRKPPTDSRLCPTAVTAFDRMRPRPTTSDRSQKWKGTIGAWFY